MRRLISLSVLALSVARFSGAEESMNFRVVNLRGRPISGVVLGVAGGASSNETGRSGKARLPLPPETAAKTWIVLRLIAPPKMVMISPWDSLARTPSTGRPSDEGATVVLAKRGDRAILDSGQALAAVAARAIYSAAMSDTARAFGIESGELDRALRALPARATDPYQKGMALLYIGDFAAATPPLAEALLAWGKRLIQSPSDVVNAAKFLGLALFEQGKYDKASAAYRKAMALRPDDPVTLNGLGQSLLKEGKPEIAGPILRRAAEIEP